MNVLGLSNPVFPPTVPSNFPARLVGFNMALLLGAGNSAAPVLRPLHPKPGLREHISLVDFINNDYIVLPVKQYGR